MLSSNTVIHGPFDSLWDAKARHAIFAPAFTTPIEAVVELEPELCD